MKLFVKCFMRGLHSNIPLCCVIQWSIEGIFTSEYGRQIGDLPWRKADCVAYYWPCSIHTWLINRGWCRPRKLYICRPDEELISVELSMRCPHCNK